MNIQSTIKELEEQKTKIEVAIASLQNLNGSGKAKTASGPQKTILGVTITHLRKVGEKQTNNQIRKVICRAGVMATNGSIQTVLGKHARGKKDLVRVGRGLWGLREWKK